MTLPIAAARAAQRRYFATFAETPLPTVAEVRDAAAGSVPLRIVKPVAGDALKTIVFLRGSGFWAGDLDSHAQTVRSLARMSGCAVCAVDYRRTPEHAWPAQRDDVVAVLDWLQRHGAAHGLDATAPVLLGESAGATLALSAALARRDAGAALPAGLVLFYPNSAGPRDGAPAYAQWVWRQYLGGADADAVPGPVPARQPLAGLPPVWLACGERDAILADTIELDAALTAAGVPHALHRCPDMPHAFLMFSATLQPAHDALAEAAAAARRFAESR